MLTLNVKSFYIKGQSLTINVKKNYIKGNFYIKGCNNATIVFLAFLVYAVYLWNLLSFGLRTCYTCIRSRVVPENCVHQLLGEKYFCALHWYFHILKISYLCKISYIYPKSNENRASYFILGFTVRRTST